MKKRDKERKSLYVHPFPDFELRDEKWLGVSFGAGRVDGESHDIPLVGFVFDGHEYAAQIYGLILRWTEGDHVDESKRIRVAVVEESASSYIFFCHPNFDHPSAVEFYDSVEGASSEKDSKQPPSREAAMLFLGKQCDIGPGSRYEWFRDRYQDGVPVMLEFSVANEDRSLCSAEGTSSIAVFDVKLARRDEIDERDQLFELLRFQEM